MGRRTMENHLPRMPAISRAWFVIAASTLCGIATTQSPVNISLAVNSPTQPAATPTIAAVSVSDSAGPVRFGTIDILDGSQKVQTLQLVSTSASGFTPGPAHPASHLCDWNPPTYRSFSRPTADTAATSPAFALTVSPGIYTSTSALHYAQTIDFVVNDAYNAIADVVVADFNNDGIPDIATVQGYPNALTISLAD